MGKNQATLLDDYYGHLRQLTKQEPKLLGIYAILRDKIRVASGRQQIYGTQCGQPTPPIQREDTIDQRRAQVGLEPLAEYRARLSLAK